MQPTELFKKLGITPSLEFKKENSEITYHFGESRIYYTKSIEKPNHRMYDIKIINEGEFVFGIQCYIDYIENVMEIIKSHIQYLK